MRHSLHEPVDKYIERLERMLGLEVVFDWDVLSAVPTLSYGSMDNVEHRLSVQQLFRLIPKEERDKFTALLRRKGGAARAARKRARQRMRKALQEQGISSLGDHL